MQIAYSCQRCTSILLAVYSINDFKTGILNFGIVLCHSDHLLTCEKCVVRMISVCMVMF